MIGTVWNNGSYCLSGAGYGIKISKTDRDKYFNRDWKKVLLELGDEKVLYQLTLVNLLFGLTVES